MKPPFQQTTSRTVSLCELELHSQRYTVFLDMQFDHRRFDEPQRIYPVEEPQREWEEINGELYYIDPRAMVGAQDESKVSLATVTAWYYPEHRRLTLWRMTGLEALKQSHQSSLQDDQNIARIWMNLERLLLAEYGETREIVALAAPFTFPDENRPWQDFLRSCQYRQHPADKRRYRRFC